MTWTALPCAIPTGRSRSGPVPTLGPVMEKAVPEPEPVPATSNPMTPPPLVVTSSRDSQLPAGIVPVAPSAYQQALCPVLNVIVAAGAEPCAVEATLLLLVVHAGSVAWVVWPGEYIWFPEMSRVRGAAE